jgi:hypothetical protein
MTAVAELTVRGQDKPDNPTTAAPWLRWTPSPARFQGTETRFWPGVGIASNARLSEQIFQVNRAELNTLTTTGRY